MRYNYKDICGKAESVLKRLLVWICIGCLLVGCSKEKGQVPSEPNQTPQAVRTAQATEREQVEVKVELMTPVPTFEPTFAPTPEPTPERTPEPTPEPTATAAPMLGVLDGRFADKFVEGEPVLTDMSYQSDRVAIFITRVEDDTKTISRKPYVYYLADVYFKSMDDFRAGFYHNMDFKYKYIESLNVIAKEYNGVFALTGDYIRIRDKGLCIRNGVLCRDIPDEDRDVGVIYRDGTMVCYEAQNTPTKELIADENIWHIFGFGPSLLDENGQPKTEFNSHVTTSNHRCAIGYFEPGHFCFLFVQGDRKQAENTGLTLVELSQFMYNQGCRQAFNLDGGGTACMYFNGKILNAFGRVTRKVHDIIYIPFS